MVICEYRVQLELSGRVIQGTFAQLERSDGRAEQTAYEVLADNSIYDADEISRMDVEVIYEDRK